MTLRTILVPTANGLDLIAPLDTALSIARPLRAHIDVVYVMQSATVVMARLPEAASLLNIESIEQKTRQAADQTKMRFGEWCAQNGLGHTSKDHLLGSTFARWTEEERELSLAVAQEGRLADLIVVNRPLLSNIQASQCFDAAVFSAGRPTLLVSKSNQDNPLRHVLVAWNGSLEATHAIALGIDLLHTAGQVSIFCASQEVEAHTSELELSAALRWHGIESNVLQSSDKADSVGEALLNTAHQHNASLILMGAYTHSRIRETLLGGVTQYILHHSDLPVIMAH